MSPLRIAGLAMLFSSLLFSGVDLYHYAISSGSPVTVIRIWNMISSSSLTGVQSFIQGYLWAPIWDNGIGAVILLPAWMFFAIIGALAFLLGNSKVE